MAPRFGFATCATVRPLTAPPPPPPVRRAPSCSGRCGPALRWPSPAQPLRSPAACRTPRSRSVPAMAGAGALPLLLPLLLPSAADAADALPTISGYWMALGLGAAGVTTTLLLTSRFLVS